MIMMISTGWANERLHPPIPGLHCLYHNHCHTEGKVIVIIVIVISWDHDRIRNDHPSNNLMIRTIKEIIKTNKDYAHPSNALQWSINDDQIDEGLKLQCDDLDRLGSAIGEMGIQVSVFLYLSVFVSVTRRYRSDECDLLTDWVTNR